MSEDLLKQLRILYTTWPSDGWDGAARAIAAHAQKTEEVEKALGKLHEESGQHGPAHPYYSGVCCCRAPLPPV